MDLNINYYNILGVNNLSSENEIKKSFRNLSFQYHPDKNKESDPLIFQSLLEAYQIIGSDDSKKEYDRRSKFGKDYNEDQEFFNVDLNFDYKKENDKYEDFRKNQILNIVENIDKNFDGNIEYQRWVICKSCNGSGKDLKSKLVIKDSKGNIKGIFDSDEGCDFCEGSGKDQFGSKCSFCFGQGKIGSKDCNTCKGEKRILGKQKLSGIKINEDKSDTIIKSMGHFSKNEPGKVGDLILIIIQ